MSFSILLIGLSLALFVYWFRYTCLLILRTHTAEDFSSGVVRRNGLSFEAVRQTLETEPNPNLDELYRSLERDFTIIKSLIDQVDPGVKSDNELEHRLLNINFRATQIWFRVTRTLGLPMATSALEEMSETIAHFANNFGEYNSAGA